MRNILAGMLVFFLLANAQAAEVAQPGPAQVEQMMKTRMQEEIAAREASNPVMASMIAVRLKSLKVSAVNDCQPEQDGLVCEVSYSHGSAGGKIHEQSRPVSFEKAADGWRMRLE